jgi:hypothetical protein
MSEFRTGLWPEVRYRLLVLALMGAVIGALGIASHGSVRLGERRSDDAPYMHEYVGAVTAWSKGTAGLGGWLTNQTDRDCPSVVVWVQSDVMDDLVVLGPVAEANGFVPLGVVHAHQRVIWAGYRHDAQGRIAPLEAAPRPDPSFICYR